MSHQKQTAVDAVALIYCRVSSVAQLQKGHGLASQETRCREFARMKGYKVAEVYTDEAVSGSVIDRPGMQAMLADIRKYRRMRPGVDVVSITDDISRIARSLEAHLALRAAIAKAGARLESPSIEFGEDSDAKLVEHLLASVAEHHRQKNTEQTKNRMSARILNGYWPFHACIGFAHEQKSGEGKVLVRDEPIASIIQDGLEGYASGRFQLQSEVKRFFESHSAFPKDGKGQVRNQLVKDILTRPLYAGYVERPEWGISLRKGRHEGLITLETFEKIQKRLREGARTPARADLNQDFPLRGTISCAHCGHPLTGYRAKSKTGARHPYYMCFNKGCERKGKSIRRAEVENAFGELLQSMMPNRKLFDLALSMFKDAWDQRMEQIKAVSLDSKRKVAKVEKQIDGLMDRIVDADNDTLITAYEKRIAKLQREKLLLEETAENSTKPQGRFEELFELAFRFLTNPYALWRTGIYEVQQLVLKLTFADRLSYCKNEGFRTPETTLPFKALKEIGMPENKMAERKSA